MDFIVNCFQDSFLAEFVAKFLVVKTDNKISRLSLDFFLGRVWPELWAGMAILCEVVLCVIAGNLITCCICVRYVNICVFQCINIMDVNYICLHGTWPEV